MKNKIINVVQVLIGNIVLAVAVEAFIVPSGIPMGGATIQYVASGGNMNRS